MSSEKTQNILENIRVLDFTRVLAGPYATRILGDFGAEVIKVQSKKTAIGAEDNNSAYFSAWNRNKLSITLDMDYPEAREIALKLVARSDVVIDNYSPRVMLNWGMDYENLRQVKKDIIMISVSGFGHTGPWKDCVAFAPTIQSLAGQTFLNSYDADNPAGLGFSHADIIAGLYGVFLILSALEYRDRTGHGQFIDLSEYEAMCTMIGPELMDVFLNNRDIAPGSSGSWYDSAVPYGFYRCRGEDKWCAIAVFDDEEWKALCNLMEKPSWISDAKFNNKESRLRYRKELDQEIEEWTMKHSAEDLVEKLQKHGISAGVVQDAKDLANDPHLNSRGFFKEMVHPVFGKFKTDKIPIKFKNSTQQRPWKPSPLLGADNEYVFKEILGLTDEEIMMITG